MAITGKGTYQDFGYTGGMQSFTAPYSGLYLFQLWGASGGAYTNRSSGGVGGYVYGYKIMTAGDVLYLCVGGAGGTGSDTSSRASGGYNGGGYGGRFASTDTGSGGGGGGATSLSTANTTIAGNMGACLLIAGGGGGGGQNGSGGSGGGYGSLNGGSAGDSGTTAPTPTSAGIWTGSGYTIYSSAGQGLHGWPSSYSGASLQLNGGGGGGRYGGSSGQYKGGTGGSGYIGGLPTITFNGATYASGYGSSRSGNGLAKVTFIDYSSNLYFEGTRVTAVNFDNTNVKKVIYNGTTVYG